MSVKFYPNKSGMEAFLKSEEMQRYIEEVGNYVAHTAGEGYGVQMTVGPGPKGRARATVMAETEEAKISQARNHDLERALGGGFGGGK